MVGPATAPRSRRSVSQAPSRSLVQVDDQQPVAPDVYELLAARQIPWTDWSISGAMAIELTAYLERSRPKRVLEIGSGVSTVILAAYARRYPADDIKVTTLEHKWAYHLMTGRALRKLGLADRVELRHARLRKQEFDTGEDTRWYDWYDVQLQGEFDFVFVDGPPMEKGREVVYYAIAGHLARGWEIWLDDGRRAHESECIRLWQKHFPDHFYCRLEDIDGKGVWILREQPSHEKSFDLGILADGDTAFLEQVMSALRPYLRDGDAIVKSDAGRGLTAPVQAFRSADISTYNARVQYQTEGPRDHKVLQELVKLVRDRRVEYVLYLQQYWLTRTLDDDWLGRALEVFRHDQTIEQVQLRHQMDKFGGRPPHDRIKEDGSPPFDAPIAFEPSLIRAGALRAYLHEDVPADIEWLSRQRLRTVNLSPGVFSRTREDGRFQWISIRISRGRTRALSHRVMRSLTPSRWR
jgi:hypothetical protein